LAVDQVNSKGGINGNHVRLVIEDDGYNTAKSISAYSKMVSIDKPSVIFMQTYGAIFALGHKPEKDNVVVIDVLDCNDDIAALPKNIFCLATQTESVAAGFVSDILKNKYETPFILYEENDPWMEFIQKSSVQKLDQHGIKAIHEGVQASVTDFKSLLLKAKSKKVDAIIFLGNDQMGTALKQARDLGLQSQFYSVGSMTSPGFQALAGDAAQNTLVSFWESSESLIHTEFLNAYSSKYGAPPILQLAAVPAYDAAKISLELLRVKSQSDLGSQLLKVKNYQGLGGRITFDKDGAVRTIHEKLYIFKNSKLLPYIQ
jgi:branched-chain amino acid transport system substrate-binding protein